MDEGEEYDGLGNAEAEDEMVEFLQSLVKDNEFLQRENLLLEAFLAKVDPSKVNLLTDEDPSKVRAHHPPPTHEGADACRQTCRHGGIVVINLSDAVGAPPPCDAFPLSTKYGSVTII